MSNPLALRVAFRYKEKKQTKVDRLSQEIRDKTGLSKRISEDVADAIVRGRNLDALTLQKGWPVNEDGHLTGPNGHLDLSTLSVDS